MKLYTNINSNITLIYLDGHTEYFVMIKDYILISQSYSLYYSRIQL